MVKLLIVADDLSGALDTGTAFSTGNINTLVTVDACIRECILANPDVMILAVDANTRHLTPAEAYRVVFDIVKEAKALGVEYIYKKTDSALRGNIGRELEAALYASGESQIHFAPAYPKHKRHTVGGIHYINGIPVAQSVFGRDPYEPVKHSSVLDILAAQTGMPVTLSDAGTIDMATNGIIVYNICSDQDMEQLAAGLCSAGKLTLLAGCGGLAEAMLTHLQLPRQEAKGGALFSDKLLLVCGSVNPITAAQLNLAEDAGFARLNLPMALRLGNSDQTQMDAFHEKWKAAYHDTGYVIIDTMDMEEPDLTLRYAWKNGIDLSQMRERITFALGQITKRILDDGFCATLMVTGGDTVLGLLRQLRVHTLEPICEITPGTILSQFTYQGKSHQLLTKSGGFGDKNLLFKLMHK
jgi:D-threonate/D-erythronate kinase